MQWIIASVLLVVALVGMGLAFSHPALGSVMMGIFAVTSGTMVLSARGHDHRR